MCTRAWLVPFVLCTTGVLLLFLAGCRKDEKPSLPSNSPAVYMKDPAFRAALDAKTRELRALVRERAPLAKRMEELARANNKDLAALQKLPEWNELYRKVTALNEKYETLKRQQLKIVGDRIAPEGQGGKDSASPLTKEISK